MDSGKDDVLGALVGWTAMPTGERVVLNLQTVRKPPPHTGEDVERHALVLTSTQAVQLGNYLFSITGQTPPSPRPKGVLGRLLGG